MARRKRRAPEVLRRAYGSRAFSLAETVLSLLPSPPLSPSECRCRGHGCLGCGGERFLLRSDDVLEYRKLLKRGFCVVAADVPRPADLTFESHWSQDLIVRSTIESMMAESPKPANVLCHGYDKLSYSSPCGEFLSTSSWNLLLSRIGDQLMNFLLKSSSIFLPLSDKLHHQVAGLALDKILQTANQGSNKRKKVEPKSKVQTTVAFVCKDMLDANGMTGSTTLFEGDVPRSSMYYKNGREAGGYTNLSCQQAFTCSNYDDQESRCYYRRDEVVENGILERNKSSCSTDCLSGNRKTFVIDDICPEVSLKQCDKRNIVAAPPDTHCSLMDVQSSGEIIPSNRNLVALYAQKDCWKQRKLNNSQQNGLYKKQKLNNSQQDVLNNQIFDKMVLGKKSQEKLVCSVCQPSEQVDALDNGDHEDFSFVDPEYSKKRQRLTGWQNSVKHRKMDHLTGILLGNCHKNEENLHGIYRTKPILNSGFHFQMTPECFSCLLLQSESTVSNKKEIQRKFMFYNSLPMHRVFPRNHSLNRLKPNISGARDLLKDIFGTSEGLPSAQTLPCCRDSSTCIHGGSLYHPLLRSFKVLIRNAQHCQYLRLLNKHCLNPSSLCHHGNKTGKRSDISSVKFNKQIHGLSDPLDVFLSQRFNHSENADQQSKNDCKSEIRRSDPALTLNGCYCSHHDVVAFVWAVCRSIVPVDLLGDARTWRPLRKNISKFIRARRFEKFTLEQCLHGIKTSSFQFLSYSLQCPGSCYNAKIRDLSSRMGIEKFNSVQMSTRKRILKSWIYWLFSYIILPVVGSHFYVTEKEGGKQDVFYFPKPFWKGLVDRTASSLKGQTYRMLEPAIVRKILRKRSFGFSKVRFRPKEKGIRPLLNLKAPSKLDCLRKETSFGICSGKKGSSLAKACSRGRITCFRPVNSVLRDVDAIFKTIKVERSKYLGASVFDYNDVYQRLCPFLSKLRKGSTLMPRVFIIVSDVSKAFDSINQNKLLGIMRDIIKKDEYHIRRFSQVICTKKSLVAMYGPLSCRENGSISINKPAAVRICSSSGILVDQGTTKRVKREVLYCLLQEHLKHNLVQLGGGFFLQKVGIPQGSLISALLCSFYYGHMERNVILPFLHRIGKQVDCPLENIGSLNVGDKESATLKTMSFHPYSVKAKDDIPICTIQTHHFGGGPKCDSAGFQESLNGHLVGSYKVPNEQLSLPNFVLMRLIDDFLLISTSAEVANGFLDRLKRGFREYNCFMNSKKFATNFDTGKHSLVSRVHISADGVSFIPWSGLLLNCQTLEIQADYTRYWDVHMKSTLTVLPHDKPGHHLKVKLCGYMRPKCHPIFYDSNVNSPGIVALNAYQAFLVCAMKFHCYIRALSLSGISLSPNYCADIIQRSFRYMYKLIKKRMYDMEDHGNIRPILRLRKEEVLCLGLLAYVRVLKKKQSRHVELLSLLNSRVENFHYMINCSSHINYTGSPSNFDGTPQSATFAVPKIYLMNEITFGTNHPTISRYALKTKSRLNVFFDSRKLFDALTTCRLLGNKSHYHARLVGYFQEFDRTTIGLFYSMHSDI